MNQPAAIGELRLNWRAIAVGFAMAFFAWGSIFYAHGVFKASLEAKHGWSGLMLSTAQAWFWAVGAVAAFGVGAAVDRFGPRAVACYGAYATAIGVAAVGLVMTPWQLFLAYALLATAYPTIGNLGISAALAPLFQRRYAAALGYALTGASLGGAVVTPVYIWLTATLGFDWASAVIAAATLLCLTPLLRWAPARQPQGTHAENALGLERFRSALRSPVFWAIWLTGFLSFTGQVGFLFHEISIFTPRMGLVTAGYAVSVTVISAAIGRFFVGWAASRMPLGILAAVMYLVQVLGFVIANMSDAIAPSFVAAAIIGFVVGPLVMLPAMLTRAAFGALGFGKIFGVINIGMFAGMTAGPGLAGIVADRAGYELAIWLFASCLAAAAIVVVLGFKPLRASSALG